MGALTGIGSGVGAYIFSMAVLSPCPLLVDQTFGGVIIVSISNPNPNPNPNLNLAGLC